MMFDFSSELAPGTYFDPHFKIDAVKILPGEYYVTQRDIVIVNGTAHHLDDAEFESLMSAARGAAGAIVCDHARDESTPMRSRFLQSIDRGRHVRPCSVFASLAGWRRLETVRFPIRIAGLAAWDYFASAYRPEAPA